MPDNVKIEIKLDNRQKIKGRIKTQLLLALEKYGMVCEEYAKNLCAVGQTGALRNRITHNVEARFESSVIFKRLQSRDMFLLGVETKNGGIGVVGFL